MEVTTKTPEWQKNTKNRIKLNHRTCHMHLTVEGQKESSACSERPNSFKHMFWKTWWNDLITKNCGLCSSHWRFLHQWMKPCYQLIICSLLHNIIFSSTHYMFSLTKEKIIGLKFGIILEDQGTSMHENLFVVSIFS